MHLEWTTGNGGYSPALSYGDMAYAGETAMVIAAQTPAALFGIMCGLLFCSIGLSPASPCDPVMGEDILVKVS